MEELEWRASDMRWTQLWAAAGPQKHIQRLLRMVSHHASLEEVERKYVVVKRKEE